MPEIGEAVVYVVDDHEDTCLELADALTSIGRKSILCATAHQFLAHCPEDRPGCLILDVRLPGMGGLVLQEKLVAMGFSMPIIFITGYADVWTAVQTMKRGAFDFLEKPFSLQELLTRVEEAITVNVAQWRTRASTHEIEQMLMNLTAREREVVVRIGSGMNSKTIARELGVSTRTVEYHRGKIRRKLGSTSQNDLSRFALDFLTAQFDSVP